ncbi:hypothetical protein [Sphingomonas jatrophae]|uniref:Uncharacterized protein n=1 Tax=Sphingomonas jatrophae TaxID=1166337 RepID=A0A1I6K9F7_9SPHN|nr:hypothetical protein [Sphingomonas jatrophae]SFR87827.1 hypothetical protein SAMN05192580_1471 [Sphingomonas jatrophae]
MIRIAPLATLLPAILLAAAPAKADPIDGTWTSDLATAQLSDKPVVQSLAGGVFRCASCTPAYSVPADGKWHKVSGPEYWDEGMVEVVDANTVNFAIRRKGRIVGTSTDTVSSDGNTTRTTYKDSGSANGVPVEGSSTLTRLAAAPAGAHAISGSWKRTAAQSSEAGLNQTFRLDGKVLKLSTPTGESYAATLGGPAAPIVGDPAGTMVQVRKVGAAYEETGIRKGKPVYRMTFEPSADGRTLAVSSTNLRNNSTTRFTATKQ